MYFCRLVRFLTVFMVSCIVLSIPGFCAEKFVAATAEQFEVSPVFYDNMVFQQNEEIKIWGTSKCEGKYVNGRLGDSLGSGCVKNGRWEISFAPRIYSTEALVLEIYGGPGSEYVSFENIYIGDVWWVMGQSNVAFSSSASSAWREFTQSLTGEEKIFIHEIKENGHDRWRKLNKYSSASSGALACFTAKKVSDALKNEVPLGFVNMGYSGAELAQFMPPKLTKNVAFAAAKNDIYKNILIHYEKFPIKGLIWYQGEADEPVYSVYAEKLSSFIEWLRSTKNQTNRDFPVYAVELPPCFNDSQDPNRQFAEVGTVRGEMGLLCAEVKHFYICPTSDLWNDKAYSNSIHPDNKMQIASRLQAMLLAKEYGFGGTSQFFAPQLTKYTISSDEKCVSLTFSEEIKADMLTGFLIIGENWEPLLNVMIAISGKNTLTIESNDAIKIVRYNTKTENVFGEDVFLSGQNALPVPAFSVTFERLERGPHMGTAIYNCLINHKKHLIFFLVGLGFLSGLLLYRKRKLRK